ncbi:hypothetical protein [Chryseobacterium sp.]|uniref:DUF1281 family ferredoxin-like fold protein n=2 Tax=Chryseobacterium TaxID=59732 RepID=UPI002899DC02|nr:hypothetical protein [Chryseobacterium sp.]
MANWCSNTVTFTGKQENLNNIIGLFQTMIENENKERSGQLPCFSNNKEGCFFETYQIEDECTFQYETKWCPNIEILYEIAEYYKVGFILHYEELGSALFGRAVYDNQTLNNVCLEQSDFEMLCFNCETDCFEFEGKSYYSELDILEILLERKIKLSNPLLFNTDLDYESKIKNRS